MSIVIFLSDVNCDRVVGDDVAAIARNSQQTVLVEKVRFFEVASTDRAGLLGLEPKIDTLLVEDMATVV